MAETTQEKPRKEKVIWTELELRAVIEEAVLVSVESTEHIWIYIAKAQEKTLPVERHRRIGGKHVVTAEILQMFVRAREVILDRKEPEKKPEEVTAPTPISPPIDRAAAIASLTNGELFELLLQRLGPLVTGFRTLVEIAKAHVRTPERHSISEVEASSTPPEKKVAPPTPAPATAVTAIKPNARTPKKTKVLLFGFDGVQEIEIRRRAEKFDLELLFTSQPVGEPLPTIPVCDFCIVKRNPPLTRRATEGLRRRPGKANLMDANTADTALQKLSDINSRKR